MRAVTGQVMSHGDATTACCCLQDINMDHHRAAPHSILWSNINTGIGSRTFESSGDGGGNGNHTASFITFWNVK